MGVLLLILKIIGIVLLSVIGLAVLMVLCVMFWPFQYRIKAYKDAENFNAGLRVLWLCGIVIVTMEYDKEAWLKIKLFGIPVIKVQIWPVEEKKKEEKAETELSNAENIQDDMSAETKSEFFQDDFEESEMFSEEELERDIEEVLNDREDELFEKMPFLKKVKAFIDKIKELILKLREKCYNIKDTVLEYVAKAKKTYKNIRYYVKVIQHPSMKPAVGKLWKNIKRMIKHLKPRRVKAHIEFGSGDPASTMKVYGYYCLIYPYYGKQITFIPDMENKVFLLDAKVTGYMQMIRMVTIGWSLFTDKHIRKIYRLIRRKQEGKKRGRK